MTTPVTIHDLAKKDQKRAFYLFMGAMILGLAWQIYWAVKQSYFLSQLGWCLPGLFAPRLNAKVEITRYGIFRSEIGLNSASLKWNEISNVAVDREKQQMTVMGTPAEKKKPLEIVIHCPNGELDEVLALINAHLPHTARQENPHAVSVQPA